MEANGAVQVRQSGGRGARGADVTDPAAWKRLGRLIAQALPVLVCAGALAWLPEPAIPHRGIVLVLVVAPAFLSAVLAWRIDVVAGREGLGLYLPDSPDAIVTAGALAAAAAARRAWSYERDRYRRSLQRTGFYANQLGVLTSVLLAALFLGGHLLWPQPSGLFGPDGGRAPPDLLLAVGVSVTASIFTVFLVVFAVNMVRLSSYDITARAYTWAVRSIVVVAAATAGLAAAIAPTELRTMIVLGILTGVTGHHALDLFLDKANDLLGLKKADRQSSPLLSIDGIVPEHVSRLEEEGIVSIHDLAYAPTARLFFSLPYGLQAVCAWQDDALLRAKLGSERATDLFRYLGIRSAVAFRDLALRERASSPTARAGAATEANPDADAGGDGAPAGGSGPTSGDRAPDLRGALTRALRLEKDAPVEPVLALFVGDAMVDRLAAYQRAVVLQPAQFDRGEPEENAVPVPEVLRAAGLAALAAPDAHAGAPQAAAVAADAVERGRARRAWWALASILALRHGRGAARGHAHAPT